MVIGKREDREVSDFISKIRYFDKPKPNRETYRERLDQDLVQLFVGPPRPMKRCGVSCDHLQSLMIVTTNH